MTGAVLNTINTRLDAAVIAFQLDHAEAKVLIVDREFSKVVKEALRARQGEAAGHRLRRSGIRRRRRAARRDRIRGFHRRRRSGLRLARCRTTNGTRSRSTTPRARPAIPRASSITIAAPICWRSATCSPAACASIRSISGRCRCSTATAGAFRGRSRSSPARMSACARCAPSAMYDAIAEHKVTHLCGAPIVMATLLNAPADGEEAAAARGRVLHRRRAAARGGARRDEGGGLQRHACLRPDRDLRPRHRQRMARANGTRCRSPSRPRRRRARACATCRSKRSTCSIPRPWQPVPRDGETHGRGDVPRQRGDEGLSQEQGGDREGVRRRLVSFRRSRRDASRTATSSSRTAPRTSSSRAARTSPRSRSRTRSTSIPAVQAAAVVAKPDDKWGETPCAFVELKPGQSATHRGARRLVPQASRRLQVPRHVVFAELPKTSHRQDPEVQAARDGEGGVKFARCA